MSDKDYLAITLLDQKSQPLIFISDPLTKQIVQLANAPSLEKSALYYPPGGHPHHCDKELARARLAAPGMYPLNGYSMHVTSREKMCVLYFTYTNNNTIIQIPYYLTPLLQASFNASIQFQLSTNEVADNLLASTLVNIKTKINVINSNKTNSKENESKAAMTENDISELKRVFQNFFDVYGEINDEVKALGPQSDELRKKMVTQLTVAFNSINELQENINDAGLKDPSSGIFSLKKLSSSFNMLGSFCKKLIGSSYQSGDAINKMTTELDKLIEIIEVSYSIKTPQISRNSSVLFSSSTATSNSTHNGLSQDAINMSL